MTKKNLDISKLENCKRLKFDPRNTKNKVKDIYKGVNMNNYDFMFEFQKSMKEYVESIQPISKQLADAILLNQETLSKIMIPYQDIASQVVKLNSAISLPIISTDIIKHLSENMTIQLPAYIHEFQISATFLEAIRSTNFIIPKYLQDFKEIAVTLNNSTDHLYNSLKGLTNIVADNQITIDAIPEFLIKPHISVSAHFNILKDLQFYKYDQNDKIDEEFKLEFEEASNNAVQKISKVNVEWINLLKGAELSFSSSNPDKIRHSITSIRELMTQIIHFLAPDSIIKEGYKEDKWYHDNKPTRKARLHYIQTKRFGNDILVDFIEKDIEAILALFDVFQAGTHSVRSNMSDGQLKFVIDRVKILIVQLLE